MNLRIVLMIARKDLLDVLKNRPTLMALVSPLVMAVFFLILAQVFQQGTDIAMTVRYYDPDSAVVPAALERSPGDPFNLAPARTRDEVRDAVGRREAIFGVIVPAGYVAAVEAGARPTVDVLYDAGRSDAGTASRLKEAIEAYAVRLAGIASPARVTLEGLNRPNPNLALANIELASFFSLFALVVALITCGLYIIPSLLVEEKEKKTLRTLLTSPARLADVVAAKLLVGLLYTCALSLVVLLIGRLPPGSTVLLLAATLLTALFFNLVGLLIGSLSEQMTTANLYIGLACTVALLPMMLVLMPFLDPGEGALGVILHAIPSFYFAELFRISLQTSPDLAQFALSAAICAILSAAVAGLSICILGRRRVGGGR